MTGPFVADSSVAIAWTVPSQSHERTDGLLEKIAQGAQLVVPVLWCFEVANSMLVLTRRGRLAPEDCALALQDLSRLAPLVDDEGHNHAFGAVSDLAKKHSLSAYDAAYLELALRRRLPLASRDAALNKAAKRSGVTILL